MRLLILLLATFLLTGPARAHPIARRCHDRVIEVRLTPTAVVVDYLLEVDGWTVVFIDLPAVSDKVDLNKLSLPSQFYEAFRTAYASILADNLDARLDGKPLTFTCVAQSHEVKDSVQCRYQFRAPWPTTTPGEPHKFTFREGNYETEPGLVKLVLTSAAGVRLASVDAPDDALKARPATELQPGDEERLRKGSATFVVETPPAPPAEEKAESPSLPTPQIADLLDEPGGLWRVLGDGGVSLELVAALLDRRGGFVLALFLVLVWGAYHALTPGHGKSLVAAYLVGERGTVWHAVYLGVVTTVTHTGALLLLAFLFRLFPERFSPVMAWLPPVSGLLVAGMGVWLLLCRLTGRADHVHLVGDHGHGHGHGHSHGGEGAGWGRLLLLGVSGGMVPCPAAILLTVGLLNARRPELALPLLLAFSAGLGGVLVAIGVIVLYYKGFAERRGGGTTRRLFAHLPVVSAVLVTALGLWMFGQAMK